jgi:hypothetical protein
MPPPTNVFTLTPGPVNMLPYLTSRICRQVLGIESGEITQDGLDGTRIIRREGGGREPGEEMLAFTCSQREIR